jgi:ABC-type antimicrobial peptide transport system permease subunit
MALGAQVSDLRRMILQQGMAPVALGLGTGLAVSLFAGRLIQGFLFGVTAFDPVTIACVGLVITVVGIAACYIPARRTTRIDPMVALRYE